MPIHPSVNNHDNTLANAVMYYFSEQNLLLSTLAASNWLDRDTSGLLILVKNLFSASILYQMFARREIHRHYLAIVEGDAFLGTIDAPDRGKADSAIMRCVDAMHEIWPSPTCVNSAAFLPGIRRRRFSWWIFLVRICSANWTHRHQIQVHFSHLWHPPPEIFTTDSPARITTGAALLLTGLCHPGDQRAAAF